MSFDRAELAVTRCQLLSGTGKLSIYTHVYLHAREYMLARVCTEGCGTDHTLLYEEMCLLNVSAHLCIYGILPSPHVTFAHVNNRTNTFSYLLFPVAGARRRQSRDVLYVWLGGQVVVHLEPGHRQKLVKKLPRLFLLQLGGWEVYRL